MTVIHGKYDIKLKKSSVHWSVEQLEFYSIEIFKQKLLHSKHVLSSFTRRYACDIVIGKSLHFRTVNLF